MEFEYYLASVEELLTELGVPGLFSSPSAVRKIEELYDCGAPLDVVLRGIALGTERKVKKGIEVRSLGELMQTIKAEVRRVAERGNL